MIAAASAFRRTPRWAVLWMAGVLFSVGCDGTHRTEVTVEARESVVPPHGDALFLMSRWFEDGKCVLERNPADLVRSARGHTPTREWGASGSQSQEQPMAAGIAHVEFAYAVTPVAGGPRTLGGTWFAVKRSAGDEWELQEFLITNADSGYEVKRVVRSPEGEPPGLGPACGSVTSRMVSSSAAHGWRIVLPLGPWNRKRGT